MINLLQALTKRTKSLETFKGVLANSSTTTLVHNIWSPIIYSTIAQTDGNYNNITGIYTAQESGIYFVNAKWIVTLNAPAVHTLGLRITIDGVDVSTKTRSENAHSTFTREKQISDLISVNVGSKIAIEGFQNILVGGMLLASSVSGNKLSIAKVFELP